MQYTFICIYIYIYLLNIFFLFFFINKNVYKTDILKHSFNNFFTYFFKYTEQYYYVLLSFFLLIGLPPVFLFFIKLNMVISFMLYNKYLAVSFMFFFLFSSTIFYSQLFKYKVFTKMSLNDIYYKNNWYRLNYTYTQTNWYLFINFFFIIMFFSFIFFLDFFILIFNLIYVNYK